MLDKLLRNTLLNTFGKVISVGCQFLLIPALINSIGLEGYGLFLLANSIIGNFSFVELGFGKSIARYVAEFNEQKDFERLNGVINSSIGLFFLLGIFISLFIGLLYFTGAFSFFNIESDILRQSFDDVLVWILLLSVIQVSRKALERVHAGLNNFFIVSAGNFFWKTASPLLVLIVSFYSKDLELLFWMQQIGLIFSWLLLMGALGRVKSWQPKLYIDKSILREMSTFGRWSFLNSIAALCMSQLDIYLIGLLLPVSSVSIYSIGKSLYFTVEKFTDQLNSAIIPYVVNRKLNKTIKDFFFYHFEGTRINFLANAVLTFGVIIFLPVILLHWLDSTYLIYSWPFVIILLGALVARSGRFLGYTLVAFADYKHYSIVYMLGAIMNLPVTVYFVKWFGPLGAIYSTIIFSIIIQVVNSVHYFRKFEWDMKVLWEKIYFPILLFFLSFSLVLSWIVWNNYQSLWLAMGVAVLYIAGSVVMALRYFINEKIKDRFSKRIRKALYR